MPANWSACRLRQLLDETALRILLPSITRNPTILHGPAPIARLGTLRELHNIHAVHIPELPQFDDAVLALLASLGILPAVIIALVTLAFSLKSWIDGTRQVVEATQRGWDLAQCH